VIISTVSNSPGTSQALDLDCEDVAAERARVLPCLLEIAPYQATDGVLAIGPSPESAFCGPEG
jgi:hypothetical protein